MRGKRPEAGEKKCWGCGKVKAAVEYDRRLAAGDGLQGECRECHAERRRDEWRAMSPEERARDRRERYLRHRQRELDYRRRRRAEARAARESEAMELGNFTEEEFRVLCEESGNRCLCCERADVRLVPDHVRPLAAGGSNDITNIQPLCEECNGKKGTRRIDFRWGRQRMGVEDEALPF